MKKPLLTKVFNAYKVDHQLNEQSSDDDFIEVVKNAFSGYEQKIKDLQAQIVTQNNERVEGLINNAIASGQLSEADRQTYTTLAKSNFEATQKVISSIPVKKNVIENIGRNAGRQDKKEEKTDDVKASWSYRDWETKDPKGLAEMRLVDKDKFNQLYENFYGADQD